MADALKVLKKALKNKVEDSFETGDVIRWKAAGFYSYAAIKTPVGWFTTANNNRYVDNVLTFDELLEVLMRAESGSIEYAATWEKVTD